MDLDALGDIGDFLGGVGVVITLVYLAFQIRQNTKVVKVATATTRAEQRVHQSEFIAQTPEINRIFWAGIEEPASLRKDEYRHFESIFASYFQGTAGAFDLYREHAISEADWISIVATVEWILTTPGWKRYWKKWRSQYPPDLRAFVEDLAGRSEAAEEG
jgi:hypothetical protein